MQIVFLLLAVVLVIGLLDAFSRACEHVISAFGALLGGWRSDGWPRGVQEEDREKPWHRGRVDTRHKPEKPAPGPPLTPVHAAVHAR